MQANSMVDAKHITEKINTSIEAAQAPCGMAALVLSMSDVGATNALRFTFRVVRMEQAASSLRSLVRVRRVGVLYKEATATWKVTYLPISNYSLRAVSSATVWVRSNGQNDRHSIETPEESQTPRADMSNNVPKTRVVPIRVWQREVHDSHARRASRGVARMRGQRPDKEATWPSAVPGKLSRW